MAPALAERAAVVHDVAPGRVDELAGALLDIVDPGELIVALGGGRVIDTAKALAAARAAPHCRPRVAAIPTTLSAAEMTAVHRRAAGADTSLPGVRPRDRRQRPGAERLAAAGRAGRERRERARARRRGAGDAARQPGARRSPGARRRG